MQTYKPYLLHRVECHYDPTSVGLGALCDYDYMGSAEFEYGAVGRSATRTRQAIYADVPFSIVQVPLKSAVVSRTGFIHREMFALMSGHKLTDVGHAFFVFQTQTLVAGKIHTKEDPQFDRNFAMWHDLEADIYFSFNRTFLELVYNILSREPDFAKKIGAQLSIGDTVTIAKVLNGKAIHSVDRMEKQTGKVVGILDDAVVIKDYKKYRMPFEYILTKEIPLIPYENV